jgi:hypothetical protein
MELPDGSTTYEAMVEGRRPREDRRWDRPTAHRGRAMSGPGPAAMTVHLHSEITPEVLERIHRALEDEESPAPWIQRRFDALAMAKGNAAASRKRRACASSQGQASSQ